MILSKVGEWIGPGVGGIFKDGCGDEGGGKVLDETWTNIEVFSPILTFEPFSDKFLGMFEVLSSSVLDLELGDSGGITLIDLGIEVEVVSFVMMFGSTLDVCTVTYEFLVSSVFDSTVTSFYGVTL